MKALLTLDWQPPPDALPAARFVAEEGVPLGSSFISIANCESLFRRCPSGYDAIKELPGRIVRLRKRTPGIEVKVHFNAFAYAFLKGAKNYDLLFPEDLDSPFRKDEPRFTSQLRELAYFEQLGRKFPPSLDKNVYLSARCLLTRPTARDERRILAELLVSGPSTRKQLSAELSVSTSLTDRILESFINAALVKESDDDFSATASTLPMSYFLLRATIGLDPLVLLL